MSFIFFSMLTCMIGAQGGPKKMAATNFLWLHFLNNRSSIQSFFFRLVGSTQRPVLKCRCYGDGEGQFGYILHRAGLSA